jgi:hypothetical protein
MKSKSVIIKFTRSYEVPIDKVQKYWQKLDLKDLSNLTETDLKNGAEAVAWDYLNDEVNFFTENMQDFVGVSHAEVIYE